MNEPARDGSTALLWAAYHSDVAAVRALVAAGAKVNVANKYGVTPLLQASRAGDTPVMQALIDAGADVALAHPDGETPLMAASRTGRTDAVRLLLARGAKPNAADSYQQQAPLMWAAAEGHAEVVGMLLEAGANPNVRAHVTALDKREHADHPTGGFTPLMFAARNGHEAAIRALVKGGADLNITNGDGATAMTIAIVNDRFDLAKTLLDLGADPNDGSLYFAVDMHDATTDMRARDGSRLRADHPNKLNALDLVKLLLDKGADANKTVRGPAALHVALLRRLRQRLRVLPRRHRLGRRGAEADDRPGRADRVGADRVQGGDRRERPRRQRQRRQDADHGGDGRRPRRRPGGRPRLHASGPAAVPRAVQSRAGRGAEGAARRRRQRQCQGARWVHGAAPGGAGAQARADSRRWSRPAPSSTRRTATA